MISAFEKTTFTTNKITSNYSVLSGILLIFGYLTFDSFTSNWQKKIIDDYKISSDQCMCGVNLFSTLLTLISLIQHGTLWKSLQFLLEYPKFKYDVIGLSICSTFGQFIIFYVIKELG